MTDAQPWEMLACSLNQFSLRGWVSRGVQAPDGSRGRINGPARELCHADSRCEEGLCGSDRCLTRLRDLGLCETESKGSGVASGDLPFDDAQQFLLKAKYALRKSDAFARNERSVKGRMNVGVHSPPNLFNLRVGKLSKTIGCIDPQSALAGDLDLLR